jgi:hypothetical protein
MFGLIRPPGAWTLAANGRVDAEVSGDACRNAGSTKYRHSRLRQNALVRVPLTGRIQQFGADLLSLADEHLHLDSSAHLRAAGAPRRWVRCASTRSGAKTCPRSAHLGSLHADDRRPALEICESPSRSAAPDNSEPCNCANAVIRADGPDDRRADDLLGLENGETQVRGLTQRETCIRVSG